MLHIRILNLSDLSKKTKKIIKNIKIYIYFLKKSLLGDSLGKMAYKQFGFELFFMELEMELES
jgi:hypothetical protein